METIRYYREVKLPKRAKYCVWPMCEENMHEDHIAVEPFEITEEEIVDVLLTHYHVSTPEVMAQAILSKLKNG